LPEPVRDPFARVVRQWVLAPLLALQRQTELLSASLERYDAVVAQRDSASLAATFVPELRSENTRLRGLLGLGVRLGSGYVPAEVLHAAEPTNPLTSVVSAGRQQGAKPLAAVVRPEGLVAAWRSVAHPAPVRQGRGLTGPPVKGGLRSGFQWGGEAPP